MEKMKQLLKKSKLAKRLYDRLRLESILRSKKDYWLIPSYFEDYVIPEVNTPYLNWKVKARYDFQLSLFDHLAHNVGRGLVVDLGDNNGFFLNYLFTTCPAVYNKKGNLYGVNVDGVAVDRIMDKGFVGVHGNIEWFIKSNLWNTQVDLVLMFQTLEHLENPIQVLKDLRENVKVRGLIITVPYRRVSRVGFHHLRHPEDWVNRGDLTADDIHTFELCPEDWGLIFKYIGWEVLYENTYYQYPKGNVFSWLLGKYWAKYDYEGFIGFVLK